MKLALLTALAIVFLHPAWGKDVFLTRISSDYTSKTYDLLIELNDRGLINGFKTRNNKNKVKRYGVKLLNKRIPLVRTVGITLVSLRCLNFNTTRGCNLRIRYPSNVVIGKFENFQAKLKKEKGKWGLYGQKKRFTQMRLVSKKALGLLVGIKRIELK